MSNQTIENSKPKTVGEEDFSEWTNEIDQIIHEQKDNFLEETENENKKTDNIVKQEQSNILLETYSSRSSTNYLDKQDIVDFSYSPSNSFQNGIFTPTLSMSRQPKATLFSPWMAKSSRFNNTNKTNTQNNSVNLNKQWANTPVLHNTININNLNQSYQPIQHQAQSQHQQQQQGHYCYTPNLTNMSKYNNINNINNNYGMVLASTLSPGGNFISLSPYKPMYKNNIISPVPQWKNSLNNYINNQQNITFFSMQNPQTSDETLLNKMINKKNKIKIKEFTTNNSASNNWNNITSNNNSNSHSLFFNQNVNTNTQSMNTYNKTSMARRNQNSFDDEKNRINIDNIISQLDPRTTLMIKNIPNKYTISTFLEEINTSFFNKYDIIYLPIDYGNKCNLGFAFINFVSPWHIIEFHDSYRSKKWRRFNSEKICDLLYAKIQGKKELIAHFKKGSVLSFESEDKRPVILQTPNPLPMIRLPVCYLEQFIKIYPYAQYYFETKAKDKFIVEKWTSF